MTYLSSSKKIAGFLHAKHTGKVGCDTRFLCNDQGLSHVAKILNSAVS